MAFGALVVLTPVAALILREPLNRGGIVGLLTLYGLGAVLLALSIGCLALFLRGFAQATIPPDHGHLDIATIDEQALMRAFDFDPEDLRANRAGELSARQRANLRAGRTAMLIVGATMLGVTYLSITAVPALMQWVTPGPAPGAMNGTGTWIVLAIITILVGSSFLYGYRQVRHQLHLQLSFAEGRAGEGPAGTTVPPHSPRSVPVGDVAVPILRRSQAAALRAGQWYRVCYVRAPIPIVLSIDPGGPDQDRASG